jgi:hypothetical protein
MRKFIVLLLLVVGLVGVAGAVVVQENGTRVNNADKLNFKNGPDVTANGSVTDVDFSTLTVATFATSADVTVGDDLTVTDQIIDVALYSRSAGAVPVHLVKVGADGAVYGSKTETAIYDSGIYGASAGVGSGKQVWISTDGKIYAP